ncbi:MAG: DUF4333 domain-containing protein [Thermoleophilaceae bacterium]|nr:DUF4333 domain-containing protein [Thermoleophilaceae bacterium]
MKRLVPIGLLACALAVSACGTRVLDSDDASQGIAEVIEQQNPQISEVTVVCPDDIEAADGGEFECQVSGDTNGVATAVQTDDDGNFDFEYSDPGGDQ